VGEIPFIGPDLSARVLKGKQMLTIYGGGWAANLSTGVV